MAIEWNKIKADYLLEVKPKELADKYSVDINKIYKKIENDKWATELREIKANLGNTVKERIEGLTNKALQTLENIIDDVETENNIKVQACKAILDISGLKSLKQEVTGINPTNIIINNEAVEVENNV